MSTVEEPPATSSTHENGNEEHSNETPEESEEKFTSRLAEFEEMFKTRYMNDDPAYAKMDEGIPPVFTFFPFEKMVYGDGRDRRDGNNWRGGRGGGNYRGRGGGNWQDRNWQNRGGRGGGGYNQNWRQDRDDRERRWEPRDQRRGGGQDRYQNRRDY